MQRADSFPSIQDAFFAAAARHAELPIYRFAVTSETGTSGPSEAPRAASSGAAPSENPAGRTDAGGGSPAGGQAGQAASIPAASVPPPRSTRSRTFSEVADRVRRIASFLRANGVGAGTPVAILANTRPEWLEADVAVLSAGGISAAIYHSLPANDVAYILFDCGARIVFAENDEQVAKIIEVLSRDVSIPGTEDRPPCQARLAIDSIVTFERCTVDLGGRTPQTPKVVDLETLLAEHAPIEDADLVRRRPQDLATLVYTSGTTGPPKGVMQTHGNHLANIRQTFDCGLVREGMSLMLFLPLAHSFARLMGYVGFVSDVLICFPAVTDTRSSRLDPTSITRDIRELGCTCVPLVPRFLEKMRDGVFARARRAGFAAKLLRLTIWASREYRNAQRLGRAPSMRVQVAYAGTGGIRARIKEGLFGAGFEYAVSGGAKLPVSVAEFFDNLGIEILEGYGLTETCVATNVNRIGRKKLGTVGPVLADDIEMRTLDDGEILFRGPNVAKGYLNRPTATASSWDADGWFHTGDLGTIDEDGYLTIRGRKKELFKTSGGKYIAPHDIEDRVKALPLVSNAVLVGDGRPYCVVLVTIDGGALKEHLAKSGVTNGEGTGIGTPSIRDEVMRGIEEINATLPSYETVKNVLVLPEELTVDNGLLTPSYKVKRGEVERRFAREIDELYERTSRPHPIDEPPI